MTHTLLSRLARPLVATAALALVVGVANPADAASITILDQTLPGPLGGAKLCADSTCQTVLGVANLHVRVALNTTSLIPPVVTTSTQPGCTANVNLQINVTSLGATGSLDTLIEFDRTDQNGAIVGHTSLPVPSVPFSVASQTHSVSLCTTIL